MPDPREQFLDMPFPLAGVDVSTAFDQQPGLTSPEAVNTRAMDPATMRQKGASRSGLAKFIPARISSAQATAALSRTFLNSWMADPEQAFSDPLPYPPDLVAIGAIFPFLEEEEDDEAAVGLSSFGGVNFSRSYPIVNPRVIQHLNILVSVDPDAMLDSFDYVDGDEDPSDGGRSRGRLVRHGGSGRQPSKQRRKTPRIKWTTPAAVDSGTTIDSTQLNAHIQDPQFDAGGNSGLDYVDGTFVYKMLGQVAGNGDIRLGVWDAVTGTGMVVANLGDAAITIPIKVTFTPTEETKFNRPSSKTILLTVNPATPGGGAGTGTLFVDSVNSPLDAFLTNIVINGDALPDSTLDYHAMGWPAGQRPVAGNTYDCQADPDPGGGWLISTLVFTSFTPSASE